MAVVEAGAGGVDGNSELGVLIAAAFELIPIAGGEQNTIAIENVSAPDFARERIKTGVALRALDAVVFEDFGFAGQEILIVGDLIICRESQERRGGRGERKGEAPHGR